MSFSPHLITAISTPLHADDTLHEEGLEILINDQLQAGIHGLLIGGTMGAMQLLSDETYCQLLRQAMAFARGRGELLAGAGDLSFARTWQRIQFLNTLPLDGIAVLPPFFLPYDAEELFDYYQALADGAEEGAVATVAQRLYQHGYQAYIVCAEGSMRLRCP